MFSDPHTIDAMPSYPTMGEIKKTVI